MYVCMHQQLKANKFNLNTVGFLGLVHDLAFQTGHTGSDASLR
jgi:hypothetical protein